MLGLLRAGFLSCAIAAACSSPMGPQGDPGPAGPPGAGAVCGAPMTTCGAACVDLTSDAKNCGACGVACSDACVMGACCGDGKKNGAEECDKSDLGGATCASALGAGWTGAPTCAPSCKLDTKACMAPATQWNDFTNASNWSTFDGATVNGGARGYNGAGFDGRYVYFVPYYNGGYDGLVMRYDTQAGFGAAASWTAFDVTNVNGNARGFQHSVFDGRYLYLIPGVNSSTYHGFVTRLDTTKPFTDGNSWSVYDLTQQIPAARGYHGAVFDGRYVYLVPYYNGAIHGLVARYDTKQGFGYSGAWSAFDVSTINGAARGFLGGAFDGRYVYFAPYGNASGTVVRLDTQAVFGSNDAWSTFDATTVNPAARGYFGISFDGRYMYFVPHHNGMSYHGLVLRYDTQGMFGDMNAWSTFDLTMLSGGARGFATSRFDGRYVYFVPYYNGMHDGVVARFDTMDTFSSMVAWKTFDATSVNGGARGFLGSAFDGRYVYFSPHYNGMQYNSVIARFDAKSVSWLPKDWLWSQY